MKVSLRQAERRAREGRAIRGKEGRATQGWRAAAAGVVAMRVNTVGCTVFPVDRLVCAHDQGALPEHLAKAQTCGADGGRGHRAASLMAVDRGCVKALRVAGHVERRPRRLRWIRRPRLRACEDPPRLWRVSHERLLRVDPLPAMQVA